jgi:hypothetical protein
MTRETSLRHDDWVSAALSARKPGVCRIVCPGRRCLRENQDPSAILDDSWHFLHVQKKCSSEKEIPGAKGVVFTSKQFDLPLTRVSCRQDRSSGWVQNGNCHADMTICRATAD